MKEKIGIKKMTNMLNRIREVITVITVLQAICIYLYFNSIGIIEVWIPRVFVILMIVVFVLSCIATAMIWISPFEKKERLDDEK